MDIQKISEEEIKEIIAKTGFDYDLILKDYYITVILYLIKEIKGIYFKGGTALQLTILNHSRISEDIDFAVDRPISKIKKEIEEVINNSGFFGNLSKDKDVEGFIRIVVPYESDNLSDKIFIDLNKRGKIFNKPEIVKLNHLYNNIPKFSFPCLSREEMIAEKVAAAIGRNKPRDHYDIYKIIKSKIPINLKFVEKKCVESGYEFDIIKMFNRAKKLHKRWNEDLLPLLVDEVTFEEVMKTISDYFGLKNEKEKKK